jgi:D-glycero-alpha-D-manno-heptose-7-phosphate kinase
LVIISRTPFRISFFGGGSDFPAHYRRYGGAVLAAGINQYAYLSVHRLAPFFPHRYRASYARTESVRSPADFEHPLIRECLLQLAFDEPLEISHVADLPGRTGIASSSSFTVGLLHALHAFRGEQADPARLAREAIQVERERVGDAGGHQDQYAVAFGGFNRIDFPGDQQVTVRPVALPPERLRELEQRLLLVFTGIEMSAAAISREQQQGVPGHADRLQAMAAMVHEAQTVLEGSGPLAPWGELLHKAWHHKKRLASGISNREIDDTYDRARRAGALGGKVLGAGGRGFMLFYVEPEHRPAVLAALPECQAVPFAFSQAGSKIIYSASE